MVFYLTILNLSDLIGFLASTVVKMLGMALEELAINSNSYTNYGMLLRLIGLDYLTEWRSEQISKQAYFTPNSVQLLCGFFEPQRIVV